MNENIQKLMAYYATLETDEILTQFRALLELQNEDDIAEGVENLGL